MIKQRVEAVGGTFAIANNITRGTTATLPYPHPMAPVGER
jgi:signal transduction histidine kinase